MEIVIELIKEDDISFHFVATNISSIDLSISRLVYSMDNLIDVETERSLRARNFSPGGRITLPTLSSTILSPNGLLKSRKILVFVQYEKEDMRQVDQNSFTSEYIFSLPDGAFAGQTVDPVEWKRSAGTIEQQTGRYSIDNVLNQLRLPVGTIRLDIPEKRPDGTINFTEMRSGTRSLIFDASKQVVYFSVQYSPGWRKTLQAKLRKSISGMHKVALSWDDS